MQKYTVPTHLTLTTEDHKRIGYTGMKTKPILFSNGMYIGELLHAYFAPNTTVSIPNIV